MRRKNPRNAQRSKPDQSVNNSSQNPNQLLKWLGFITLSKECSNLLYREWNTRSLAFFIASLILMQILVSFFIYPALTVFSLGDMIHLAIFTSCHILLAPLYIRLSLTFMTISVQ